VRFATDDQTGILLSILGAEKEQSSGMEAWTPISRVVHCPPSKPLSGRVARMGMSLILQMRECPMIDSLLKVLRIFKSL
jgi:hypothetical protein